jgi:hypothetical protein
MFFYKIKILLFRILGYDKPLRLAILKIATLKFKKFRPHYETIILESAIEAKKIGYKKISILELGVAGGNGLIALEKYKKKVEKFTNIKINIFGFDTGEGLPKTQNKFDLPYYWSEGDFKIDKEKIEKKIKSKIYYGDIKDTFEKFIESKPEIISAIFLDMDYYTSTKNFLDLISRYKDSFAPRVYFYFDDIFSTNHHINEHNGELLAIKEFNEKNLNIKIGKSINSSSDFKFPIAKEKLFIMNNFDHEDYFVNINSEQSQSLSLEDTRIEKIF